MNFYAVAGAIAISAGMFVSFLDKGFGAVIALYGIGMLLLAIYHKLP